MNLFKIYKRALLMLLPEGRAVYFLAIANAGIGLVQLAEPMLFGAIVDALAGNRPTSVYILTWAVIGIVGIIASVVVSVAADRMAHRCRLGAMAEALPPAVVRAKGFVEEKGDMYLFSYVMGDWTVEKTDVPKDRIKHKNVVVFIGPPESMEGIEKASKTGDWSNKGVFQPYSQS